MTNKTKWVMGLLIFAVVVLGSVVVYAFLVQPALTGYAVERQQEGAVIAVGTIWERAAQCQTVPLTLENQTINLVALECLQQAQEQTGNQALAQ